MNPLAALCMLLAIGCTCGCKREKRVPSGLAASCPGDIPRELLIEANQYDIELYEAKPCANTTCKFSTLDSDNLPYIMYLPYEKLSVGFGVYTSGLSRSKGRATQQKELYTNPRYANITFEVCWAPDKEDTYEFFACTEDQNPNRHCDYCDLGGAAHRLHYQRCPSP